MKNSNLATARESAVTEPLPHAATLKKFAKEARAIRRIAGGPIKAVSEDGPIHTYDFNILTGWWMRILRVREASIYLGVRPAQLRKMVERGELPYIGDLGTPMRFDIRDLDKWIERSKRTK